MEWITDFVEPWDRFERQSESQIDNYSVIDSLPGIQTEITLFDTKPINDHSSQNQHSMLNNVCPLQKVFRKEHHNCVVLRFYFKGQYNVHIYFLDIGKACVNLCLMSCALIFWYQAFLCCRFCHTFCLWRVVTGEMSGYVEGQASDVLSMQSSQRYVTSLWSEDLNNNFNVWRRQWKSKAKSQVLGHQKVIAKPFPKTLYSRENMNTFFDIFFATHLKAKNYFRIWFGFWLPEVRNPFHVWLTAEQKCDFSWLKVLFVATISTTTMTLTTLYKRIK